MSERHYERVCGTCTAYRDAYTGNPARCHRGFTKAFLRSQACGKYREDPGKPRILECGNGCSRCGMIFANHSNVGVWEVILGNGPVRVEALYCSPCYHGAWNAQNFPEHLMDGLL